jgi:hypothetical protein
LAFKGFAPDFVYRSIPAPDLTVEQVVRLGVAPGVDVACRHVGQGMRTRLSTRLTPAPPLSAFALGQSLILAG